MLVSVTGSVLLFFVSSESVLIIYYSVSHRSHRNLVRFEEMVLADVNAYSLTQHVYPLT